MIVEAERVVKRYGEAEVLKDVSFAVERGEFFGIIGPNGSGKSTLLKVMSGVERADGGTVKLDGRPAEEHSRRALARWLAVLQQEALPPVGFSVRDVVEMGRFPYQNWFGAEQEDAGALVDGIIGKLALGDMQDRPIDELSGGERQRVALGKVMAQQPQLLLLDEPTTYLDIGHQVQLMEQIREWQRESGMTVVAVLHDLNLAAMYCDRLLMLHEGRAVQIGTPADIMNGELLFDVYGIRPVVVTHPVSGVPQIMLQAGV